MHSLKSARFLKVGIIDIAGEHSDAVAWWFVNTCFDHLISVSGAGLASVVISFLMSTYYAVIIAWAIYYFFTSFKSEVPWASCSNRWNTAQCWVPYHNHTRPNGSQTPTEQFFE